MRVVGSLVALSSLARLAASHYTSNYTAAEIYNGAAFHDLVGLSHSNLHSYSGAQGHGKGTCSFETADKRLEWRAMPKRVRKSYTDAVQCLQKLPPQVMTPEEAPSYPGVHSRYDEYVATHINLILVIHFTADFLAWHRFFIHSFEHDLQTLCNYTGVLPYWNWPTDALAPQKSSLFNGDAYSMGSNGVYIAGRSPQYLAQQNVTAPPGTGGGCVFAGPFVNYTNNLGPLDTVNETEVSSPYAWNPRCLQRDLNPFYSSQFNTWQNVTTLLLDSADVATFQGVMQADPNFVSTGNFGVHGGGHFTPGPVMSDFYASPGDPLFFLHHAMIDRTWTIWQNLDLPARQNAINGTSTILNMPPSAEMTLNDTIPFGFVAKDQTLGTLMSTLGGPFCYYYV
ncbi:hypothetical protein MBLNU459_g2196t1 [Dothideomycetes sp. NU459]